MLKILYLWSVNHADIGYFQGLNELPVPFFIAFLTSALKGRLSVATVEQLQEEMYSGIEADVACCLDALVAALHSGCRDDTALFSEALSKKFSSEMVKRDCIFSQLLFAMIQIFVLFCFVY